MMSVRLEIADGGSFRNIADCEPDAGIASRKVPARTSGVMGGLRNVPAHTSGVTGAIMRILAHISGEGVAVFIQLAWWFGVG